MPKGKRFRVTHLKIKYDLSEAQYEMLSKETIKSKDSDDWKFESRVRGLKAQSLIVKRKGAYKRTLLGTAVYTALNSRVTKEAAKVAAKE